jgi:hypothetical protein
VPCSVSGACVYDFSSTRLSQGGWLAGKALPLLSCWKCPINDLVTGWQPLASYLLLVLYSDAAIMHTQLTIPPPLADTCGQALADTCRQACGMCHEQMQQHRHVKPPGWQHNCTVHDGVPQCTPPGFQHPSSFTLYRQAVKVALTSSIHFSE